MSTTKWLVIIAAVLISLAVWRPVLNGIGRAKGSGQCAKCGDSWWWKKNRPIHFEHSLGLFLLCDRCWDKLTPLERLPYYRNLGGSVKEMSDTALLEVQDRANGQ